MIDIQPYTTIHRDTWNNFVKRSKNGTFLFHRDYLEYHQDRFTDHSLLFFEDEKLLALFPANIVEDTLYSHQGLSYGGFITNDKMKQIKMMACFEALLAYAKSKSIKRIFYTPVPQIYHNKAAQEDLFALFKNGFKLHKRKVATTVLNGHRCKMAKGRKSVISKARKNRFEISQSENFVYFYEVLVQSLNRKHNSTPTHSLAEIQLLAGHFPVNIKLFTAQKDHKILSGTIIYETNTVAHAQYIAATEEGEQLGATDLLMDTLVADIYKDKAVFDFGTSMNGDGCFNKGLLFYKESLGARVTVNDSYVLENL